MTLVAVSVWIFFEAYSRFADPPEVLGAPMLAVATIGLLVNIIGAFILSRSGGESLNVEAPCATCSPTPSARSAR